MNWEKQLLITILPTHNIYLDETKTSLISKTSMFCMVYIAQQSYLLRDISLVWTWFIEIWFGYYAEATQAIRAVYFHEVRLSQFIPRATQNRLRKCKIFHKKKQMRCHGGEETRR